MSPSSQRFRLSDSFIERYKKTKPKWGPLGEFVYYRTYSRRVDGEDRNEAWYETVRRVVEGTFTVQKIHCANLRLPWKPDKAQRSAQIMYEKIFNFKFLPPGRGLWMMGTEFIYERGGMSLNNCGFVSTEDIKYKGSVPFEFMMDALMNGVGIGFDTKGAGQVQIKAASWVGGVPGEPGAYRIEDSREGWVKSVGYIISNYFNGGTILQFDYTAIRKYGEPINGFGGVASGPEPLAALHEQLHEFLDRRIGKYLSSTDIVDIMNFIGRCVIAGNVRRSAEIALGDSNDKGYLEMKNPNLYKKELDGWRWASNNSVLATVGMDYTDIVKNIINNGEPGLVWLDNIQQRGRMYDNGTGPKDLLARGVNPCGEQSLESYELCCLVETFPALHDSYAEYEETLKYAYLYAKTVTLLPTHWPETNQVLMKNRRIGTSQSGIIDAFVKHGRREMLMWCAMGYYYIRKMDQIYSDWLCVPKSIKVTSVKPSGTVSKLCGASPGIHYPHAEYYIQRIRIAESSPLLPIMSAAGYVIEDDSYQMNTKVILFPVHVENFYRKKSDVTVWEQVVNAVDYQTYWSDNNVSITATFKKEEAGDLVRILESFEDKLKAISFLPLRDHGYKQAPMTECTSEEYLALMQNITEPDFSSIIINATGDKSVYCDGDSCSIVGGRQEVVE
jgi:ribonucleoside-triphosphate reductase